MTVSATGAQTTINQRQLSRVHQQDGFLRTHSVTGQLAEATDENTHPHPPALNLRREERAEVPPSLIRSVDANILQFGEWPTQNLLTVCSPLVSPRSQFQSKES